jgi:DNA-binding SARP family transcriptional activator
VIATDRLWPDVPSPKAAASLRSVLWRLPRPRGRALILANAAYLWLAPEVQADLWQVEDLARRLCSSGESSATTADYDALRHDLLPDWDEPWLLAEQESFRQKRLHALERAAAGFCAQGRFTDALDAGLAAVQSEPLRESAHRRVIEVHLAEGNQAEALRQYDGYRRLLADELGLRPSPTIRQLVAPLLGRPADLPAREL